MNIVAELDPRVITVCGANEGALDNVDISLPLGKLLCLTGQAGSGCRDMVVNIIYAESQRRYILALAPGERRGLDTPRRASFEQVEGLPPAFLFSGDERPRGATIGHYLQINRELAGLFKRHGRITCPECGGGCRAYSRAEAVECLLRMFSGDTVVVSAPQVIGTDTSLRALKQEFLHAGFSRVRSGGKIVRIEQLDVKTTGEIEVIVDRIRVAADQCQRLGESVVTAWTMTGGDCVVTGFPDGPEVQVSQQITCEKCLRKYGDLSVRDLLADCTDHPLVSHTRLAGWNWQEFQEGDLTEILNCLRDISGVRTPVEKHIQTMRKLGLQLCIGRKLGTLSRGEWQLLKLARCLGNGLSGILYIFDQPLGALDSESAAACVEGMRSLVESGNSVLAYDHHKTLIAAADGIYHFEGGAVVEKEMKFGQGLDLGHKSDPGTASIREGNWVTISLKDTPAGMTPLNVRIPLHCLVCVTGRNGVGKSRLLGSISSRPLRTVSASKSITFEGMRGFRRIVGIEDLRDRNRCLLSFLGLAESVARIFSDTLGAKHRKWGTEVFNVDRPGGRCITCDGHGVVSYTIYSYEDISVVCPACEGRRFRDELLDITYRGLSVVDVMNMTCTEAVSFFGKQEFVGRRIKAVLRCGLENHHLGQRPELLEPWERMLLLLSLETTRVDRSDLVILDQTLDSAHPTDLGRLVQTLRDMANRQVSVWYVSQDERLIAASDVVVRIGK